MWRGEEVRAIGFVREKEAYPAKRHNQQRHRGRRPGKVPMSGLILFMATVIGMVAERVITLLR